MILPKFTSGLPLFLGLYSCSCKYVITPLKLWKYFLFTLRLFMRITAKYPHYCSPMNAFIFHCVCSFSPGMHWGNLRVFLLGLIASEVQANTLLCITLQEYKSLVFFSPYFCKGISAICDVPLREGEIATWYIFLWMKKRNGLESFSYCTT